MKRKVPINQVPADDSPAFTGEPSGPPQLCDCGCKRRATTQIAGGPLVFSDKCGPPWDRMPLHDDAGES